MTSGQPVNPESRGRLFGVVIGLWCNLVTAIPALGVEAESPELSIDHRQVSLLIRALVYEQRLGGRAGLDVHIGVVGREGDSAAEPCVRAMSFAFQSLDNVHVNGLPIKASRLNYLKAEGFPDLLERRGIDVLYLCSGLDDELGRILEMTRKRHILSVASQQQYVNRGASLGVFPIDGRLTILVNVAAAKLEGASFAPSLLRIAKVIR